MSNKYDLEKSVKFAMKKYLTYPLSGYISDAARQKIRQVEAVGFDHDIAFSIVESSMPEMEFYDIDIEDESDGK